MTFVKSDVNQPSDPNQVRLPIDLIFPLFTYLETTQKMHRDQNRIVSIQIHFLIRITILVMKPVWRKCWDPKENNQVNVKTSRMSSAVILSFY